MFGYLHSLHALLYYIYISVYYILYVYIWVLHIHLSTTYTYGYCIYISVLHIHLSTTCIYMGTIYIYRQIRLLHIHIFIHNYTSLYYISILHIHACGCYIVHACIQIHIGIACTSRFYIYISALIACFVVINLIILMSLRYLVHVFIILQVFTEQTGLENLYKMLAYCQDVRSCRRSLIGQHFGEEWNDKECKGMCDNCQKQVGRWMANKLSLD